MNANPISLDEYPILELPNTPLWTENYAVLCADPVSRAAVYYSCGRWIGDPNIWREVIGVVLPDQRIILAKNYGRNSSPQGPGASLSSWEVLEPEKKLRLRYAGPVVESDHEQLYTHGYREGPKKPCSLDISFDAVGPVWNMKGDSREASSIAGSLHIEQVGKANGAIVYDGETYRLTDAYAIRDHSRGPRDITEYRWSCWINGHLPGNRFFHLYAMQLHGSEEIGMSNAGIFENGKYYPAQLLRTDLREDAVNPQKLHTFVLGSARGELEIRTAEALTSFPTSMLLPYDMVPGWIKHHRAAHLIDQLVYFECGGERSLGWSERGVALMPLS